MALLVDVSGVLSVAAGALLGVGAGGGGEADTVLLSGTLLT